VSVVCDRSRLVPRIVARVALEPIDADPCKVGRVLSLVAKLTWTLVAVERATITVRAVTETEAVYVRDRWLYPVRIPSILCMHVSRKTCEWLCFCLFLVCLALLFPQWCRTNLRPQGTAYC
jgi:hypothetical protein